MNKKAITLAIFSLIAIGGGIYLKDSSHELDRDKNGIRDDAQSFIAKKYQHSPLLLKAFNQYAKNIQGSFVQKDDSSRLEVLRTHQCLVNLLKETRMDPSEQRAALEEVRAIMANTEERIEALKDQANVGVAYSKEEACSFLNQTVYLPL